MKSILKKHNNFMTKTQIVEIDNSIQGDIINSHIDNKNEPMDVLVSIPVHNQIAISEVVSVNLVADLTEYTKDSETPPKQNNQVTAKETSLLRTNQYQAFIDQAKEINRLPRESLKLTQDIATQRQLLTEMFLGEKGVKSQMINSDTLSNQIQLLNEEIETLSQMKSNADLMEDPSKYLDMLHTNVDSKRQLMSTLIKSQSDLHKSMQYTPDKAQIQIQNNMLNVNTKDGKLSDLDLFRLHRGNQSV
jgi:hypothetical protein